MDILDLNSPTCRSCIWWWSRVIPLKAHIAIRTLRRKHPLKRHDASRHTRPVDSDSCLVHACWMSHSAIKQVGCSFYPTFFQTILSCFVLSITLCKDLVLIADALKETEP